MTTAEASSESDGGDAIDPERLARRDAVLLRLHSSAHARHAARAMTPDPVASRRPGSGS